MFRFFRKIRHNLLVENKVSRYLLYALGEIVLIVIGIMIALQLDNYNEERKKEAAMVLNLKEFKSELESNLNNSTGILRFYSNRDSLIRQHLCRTISKDDIKSMRDLQIQWALSISWFTASYDRVIFDKILTDIENLPDELQDLKEELRILDGQYEEMDGNYERYGKIASGEYEYRINNLPWSRMMWRWDLPFDREKYDPVLDYLFEDVHYQNHLFQYWNYVSRGIVTDILDTRSLTLDLLESITGYLESSEPPLYRFPETLRYKQIDVTGTYRTFRKYLNEGERNLELGEYILFEEDGRLFSFTRYDPGEDKNYQSEEKVEWVVLNPRLVISPSGWFMHLVEDDAGQATLEYAACNNRNFYLTKVK